MKIIISAFGSFGDIKPLADIGKILIKNGYEVSFIANPYFRDYIRWGIKFFPAGTVQDYLSAIQPPELHNNSKKDRIARGESNRKLYDLMFLKPVMETFNIISNIKDSNTILITHSLAYGSKMAAEKYNLKNITVSLSGYWLQRYFFIKSLRNSCYSEEFSAEPIQNIRASVGLPALKHGSIEWMFNGKNIALYPEEFAYCQSDCIGFIEVDDRKEVPEDLLEFCCKHKPVVFTPGTWTIDQEKFFEAAAGALSKLGLYGVFLSKFPLSIPSNAYHCTFAPLESILDKCSAIVHHGGMGTIFQAIKAGIPQVIGHRMDEQKYNARKVKDLGIGDYIEYVRINENNLINLLNNIINIDCSKAKRLVKLEDSEGKLLKVISDL